MKTYYSTFLFAALVFLTGCSGGHDSDEPVKPTPPPTPTPTPESTETGGSTLVSFSASLNAMSRATDTSFENGDQIGVFAVKASDGDTRGIIANSGNYADNIPYRYQNGMLTAASTGISKTSDTKLFYTAIYPYSTQAGASFDFTVKSDQRTPASYTGSDLCTANTPATDMTTVNLTFSHRMSRIIVNLTGDGWGSDDITVSINAQPTAEADVNNLHFTAKGSKTKLTFGSNGTHSYKLILPPQQFADGSNFIEVAANGKTYDIKAQSKQSLVSGKSYEYTLNMSVSNPDEITFTGDINPWNTEDKIDDVLPPDIQDELLPWIPIYKGTTPPNIEGTFIIDPFTTVYCQDEGNGGYSPGYVVASEYVKFSNQNMTFNTIDIAQQSVYGSSSGTGTGAFISGTGNNFSAFFNTVGTSSGISTKTALIISGTKTQQGIANLRYAFVMVEKGSDPNHQLMNEGVFRVFEDGDGLSEYATWPSKAPSKSPRQDENDSEYSIYNYLR